MQLATIIIIIANIHYGITIAIYPIRIRIAMYVTRCYSKNHMNL